MIIIYLIMADRLYSNKQVLEITGEKRSRIQYWSLKGVFHAADPGSGIGTSRKYSFGNLLEIMITQQISIVIHNIGFVAGILHEIRNEAPRTFFDLTPNRTTKSGEMILTVLIQSENAIVIYVHDIDKSEEYKRKWLPKEFAVVHWDLGMIKNALIDKLTEKGML
jgi:hypothetical protein